MRNNHLNIHLVIVLALLALTPAAWANAPICEDINELANDWNAIANSLEDDADEEVGDLKVRKLERDVNSLLPDTESLGDYLIDEGNSDEVKMGDLILDMVDDLTDTDGDDFAAYLVDRIDDLVDALDYTVDYCDDVN